MSEQIVGVVGAGVIGAGVAQVLAQAGKAVVLVDVSEQILDQARQAIVRGLRMRSLIDRGAAPAMQASEVLARIRGSTDLRDLAEADFIIENVTEKWAVKQEVYCRLGSICSPRCVMAANTSAMPIARLATETGRPEQVIGLHFMNPVPLRTTGQNPLASSCPSVLSAVHQEEPTNAADRLRAWRTR